jgi:hypothetical protein
MIDILFAFLLLILIPFFIIFTWFCFLNMRQDLKDRGLNLFPFKRKYHKDGSQFDNYKE